MDTQLLAPIVFMNPITERIEVIPVEMVIAYVPYASHLRLEQAARIAAIRDSEAAANLLESITEPYSVSFVEGCGFDRLSVPFPY